MSPTLRFGAFAIALAASWPASGQDGRPPRPPEFASIEVRGDRAITARIFAPDAKAVRLSAGDIPGLDPRGASTELKRSDAGVWEITTAPVPPGTYRYRFGVDGLEVVDPRNPLTSESVGNAWSLMTVPGSAVSDLKDVPHGAVAAVPYHSKTLNRPRRMHVYTPPGYERGTTDLPVLYLLHGAGDSDDSWSTVGRAGLILDNLIASGEARPMIVVMPAGHTGSFRFGPGGSFQKQMSEFAQDFESDVRPTVERTYRVATDRAHRAIAGLSMGGAQTLDVALRHPGDYSSIGVFSSGIFGIIPNPNFPGDALQAWKDDHAAGLDDSEARKGLRHFWFATGRDDFLIETTRASVKYLESKGFQVTSIENDGGHTWINWREHYLPQFARLLFRDDDPATNR